MIRVNNLCGISRGISICIQGVPSAMTNPLLSGIKDASFAQLYLQEEKIALSDDKSCSVTVYPALLNRNGAKNALPLCSDNRQSSSEPKDYHIKDGIHPV